MLKVRQQLVQKEKEPATSLIYFKAKFQFEILPIEVWNNIVSYLPFSQLCRLGKVSRKFRYMVTQHSIWKEIIKKAGLLSRVPPQSTYYEIIILKYSKYICEICGAYCARKVGSMINLPVIIESFDMVVSLCRDCRVNYYKFFPEGERDLPKRKIVYPMDRMKYHTLPIYTAMVEYALTEYDLQQLSCAYRGNDNSLVPLVKYYVEKQVIDLARTIHGGEIGITRALMCSLNIFRATQHTKMDIGVSCSREFARKRLIFNRAKSKGLNINFSSDIYQDYILSGIGSVAATLHEFESTSQVCLDL